MMERVCILDGFLCRGGFPAYKFELRRRDDGSFEKFDYRGDAFVVGNSCNMLRHGNWSAVSEYVIAPQPTLESVEWKQGYEHGQNQKRKVFPGKNKSEAFVSGWKSAWSEKRPFRFPDEK